MTVKASISPAPIVGQTVTWRIEIATSREAPNTQLQVRLPDEVELVSGEANWHGDIQPNQPVVVELLIRVTQPGEWIVEASAFSDIGGGSGFGNAKQLYVTSSTSSASVVEDVNRPLPTVPVTMVDQGTPSPAVTITPSP
jgi:hypothetical protein